VDPAPPPLGERRQAPHATLHEALNAFASVDPKAARIIEMQFFGGLTIELTADALKISNRDGEARVGDATPVAAARDERGGR
jgi:DNA-directed RNA polymerase specialized sigma24 family protein